MNETKAEETMNSIPEEITNNESIVRLENVRMQKAEWIKQETERRRKLEDDMLGQLMTEQRMLDELNSAIDANMKLTQESRRYHEEVKENIHNRVYAMHGISQDKLSGMKEYKNAYYKGIVFGMFLLSIFLVVICGFFHGITAQITLFMAFFTGIEGALLTRERDRGRVLDGLCKLLYVLLFPAMLVIFTCYELELSLYALLLPYFSIAGAMILVLGTVSFFVYTPYREDRKKVSEARSTLRELEKQAEKEVRKNRKLREKEEKKEEKTATDTDETENAGKAEVTDEAESAEKPEDIN